MAPVAVMGEDGAEWVDSQEVLMCACKGEFLALGDFATPPP